MESLDLLTYRYMNGLEAPKIPLKLVPMAAKLNYKVAPQRFKR